MKEEVLSGLKRRSRTLRGGLRAGIEGLGYSARPCAGLLSVAGLLAILGRFLLGRRLFPEGKRRSFLPVSPKDVQPRCQKCTSVNQTVYIPGTVVHHVHHEAPSPASGCVNNPGCRKGTSCRDTQGGMVGGGRIPSPTVKRVKGRDLGPILD